MQSQIIVSAEEKRLDFSATRSTVWILKAMRTMIEVAWGMDIYQRDDDGGEEQDIASEAIVTAFNSYGVTGLCLDMIACGIHESVQLEAIKLGVAMLFREGGALLVHETINTYLSTHPSHLFFKQLQTMIIGLTAWHNWQGVIILEEGTSPSPPEEIIVIRFIQLMSEGHFRPNQDIMLEQPFNAVSFNLLSDFVNYLNALSRICCQTSTNAGIRLAATILEVIQGPCVGNQMYFALNTDLIEVMNRLLRAKCVNDCVHEEEIELKCTVIDIFQVHMYLLTVQLHVR